MKTGIMSGKIQFAGQVWLERYRQTRSTSEPHACRYVQHLIKQYNEFAIADNKRSTKFRFGAVSTSIEIRFA